MRHSLHAHIIYLENSIQDVSDRLTRPSLTAEEVEDLQLQLTLAESALEHYRQAYALELSFAGSEPPDHPGNKDSSKGAETSEKSKTNREKGPAVQRQVISAGQLLRVVRENAYPVCGRRQRPWTTRLRSLHL